MARPRRRKTTDIRLLRYRVSIDSYMNIQLSNAEEYIKNNFSGALGQVLIRCNNVLWIRPAGGEGENGDTKMEG